MYSESVVDFDDKAIEVAFFNLTYNLPALEGNTTICYMNILDFAPDENESNRTESRMFTFDIYGDIMIPYNHIFIFEDDEIILNFFKSLSAVTRRKYTFHKAGVPYMIVSKDKVVKFKSM
ncbi:hypothetical protein BFS06_13665 [Clostridium perfringens]|uniref:Uncharacterized protein n=1 Tax=Clostridium perfringens TaxID=1502 RepID=A0A140GRU0_CLOPF|nr:hypothetical protein [Clostridium perfringens]AMN31249.1 hypothetical protein JFP838_pA0333 [Clostridium perfringens]TBX14253.1 hypothetical protein BFS06_13665 [Clostridium perfringens]